MREKERERGGVGRNSPSAAARRRLALVVRTAGDVCGELDELVELLSNGLACCGGVLPAMGVAVACG